MAETLEEIHYIYEPEDDQEVLRRFNAVIGNVQTAWEALTHRRDLYGRNCSSCLKPLRSKRAAFCAACGARALAS
jgi:predicted amidophosphoribosyltransferase